MGTWTRSGQSYGLLTTIERVPGGTGYRTKWLCKCACGKETMVASAELRNGDTKSCGCLRKTAAQIRKRPLTPLVYTKSMRRDAKNRGNEWLLTDDEAIALQLGNCNYCGVPPGINRIGERTIVRNGVDRVDNTKGYSRDNCVSCCGVCNRMKGTLSVSDFYAHIYKIISS